MTLVKSEVTVIASGTQVSIISSSKALQNVDVIYTGIISGFCLPPPVSKNIRIDIFLRYFYDIQYIVSLTPTMAKGISPNEPNYESRGVLCRRFSFRRRINLCRCYCSGSTLQYLSPCWNDDQRKEPMIDRKII